MFDAFSTGRESTARSGPFVEGGGAGSDPYFGAVSSYAICAGCGRFHGVADTGGDGAQGVLVNADDRGGTGSNGKPSLLPADAGAQITRSNLTWANGIGQPTTVTFAFRGTAPTTMPEDTGGYSNFSAQQIAITLAALQSWSDVAGIVFNRVQDAGSEYSATNNATILFGNYATGADGAAAFAYLPSTAANNAIAREVGRAQGDVWINSTQTANAAPALLNYGFQTLTHEIGHAIGLSHPGPYNAGPGQTFTYSQFAVYYEDSRQYSVMSYFQATSTGADHRANGVGSTFYSAAPLLDDIAAAQRLYGANMSTRTGDTVYGFNSTADRSWYSAASSASVVIFAVWDAGGIDTLDFSGYAQNQVIDLRQGAFSSVGALIGNVAIAMGAVIENAIGGTGADQIRGNSADNRITGGLGNDSIDGGLGSDTVVFSGNRSQYTITWNGQTGTVTGPDGTDTITNVEFLQFADQTVAAAPTGGLNVAGDPTNDTMNGTQFNDTLGGLAGNDTINGLGGNDNLLGGSGDDVLNGGDGDDSLTGGLGNDVLNGGVGFDAVSYQGSTSGVVVNLAAGTATGGSGSDTLTSIEEVFGSFHNDTLTGDSGANTLRGSGGIDLINGGDGNDRLYGGTPAQSAADDVVKAQGTANAGFSNAVNLNGTFDLLANANIRNATTVPHSTVVATSHGAEEFYAFTVTAGAQIVLDVDGAGFDTVLRLYGPGQTVLVTNDDASGTDADGGEPTDSAITYTATESGTFYVSVSAWLSGSGANLVTGAPPAGSTYTLHVSVPSQTPVPITLRGSTLNGEGGDDFIEGGDGADVINGGAGNDTLNGQLGADVVDGGDGDDLITDIGDGIATTLRGGSGNDVFVVSFAAGSTIDGGADTDTVRMSGGANYVVDLTAGTLRLGSATAVISNVENFTGAGGSDRITGTAGANILIGDTGGENGNDVIIGGGGSDVIDGGAGYDVSGYAGARKNYGTVNSTTVVGGREGGTDTLTGIEAAAFVDGLTTFNADSQAAQLMRLYSVAFDRAPDALGFHVQLDAIEAGVSFSEMARRFLTSDEFVSRFGSLTDIQYVQRLYLNAFDRAPSNAEINDWLAYLNAGNSRQALMLVIAESTESRAATWSTLSAGLWVGDAVTESLARLYDTVFNRLPDEDGLITWRTSLGAGTTLLSVATTFLASAEGQAMYGGLSNTDFVTKLYQTALNRAPDAGGLAAYVAGLNAGTITREQMLVEFSESAEHRAITLPSYVGGIPTQAAAGAPAAGLAEGEDFGDAQVLPGEGDKSNDDDEAQILPVAGDDLGGKDGGAQTLPGLDVAKSDDGEGAQILPIAEDDDFLPTNLAPRGDDAGTKGDVTDAQVLPGVADDDFLPIMTKDHGAQVQPAESGLDLVSPLQDDPEDGVLAQVLAGLTEAHPTVLTDPLLDGVWHGLPSNDPFQ